MKQYPYIREEREDEQVFKFDYHPGQREAFDSDAREVLVLAGRQGGKTTFAPWWLLREIIRKGPGNYLYVTPTYPLLEKQALPSFLYLFEKLMELGHYNKAERIFHLSPAAHIELFGKHDGLEETKIYFGYAQKPSSLESITAKAAVLDECGSPDFKQESYEAIQGRLTRYKGRILMTTTPYGFGWLKRIVFDRADGINISAHTFPTTLNPAIDEEEIERLKNSMPEWRFRLFYLAQWTRPAGLIYDCFTDNHIIDRFDIPSNWKRYLGLDFGGANTAAIYIAHDPKQDIFYIYRTYHAGGKSIAEHVQHILGAPESMDRQWESNGLSSETIKAETSIPQAWGGAKSESNMRLEFSQAGLPIRMPGKDVAEVEVQISKVYQAFQENRLMIFSDLTNTIDSLQTYARKTDEQGNATEEIADKATYHLLDALRYAITGLLKPKVEIRTYKISF